MSDRSPTPLLFAQRRPVDAESAAQYAGTETERDEKASVLFDRRNGVGPETAAQYHGTDTELDQKDAAIESPR
jgi:hypothetical protein